MEMRIAQAMIDFAPEKFARLLSMASNGELSPDFAGMILRQIASGQAPRSGGQGQPPADNAGGAKFVTVERP